VTPAADGRRAPRAIVLVGGTVRATARLRAALAGAEFVIAADGGLRHAAPLGLTPDLLVGDIDSVAAADLARHPGLRRELHPTDKDALDLELALDAAAARGARNLTVVGGLSGRLDQTIATVLVIQARHAAGVDAEALDGHRSVWPLRPGEVRTLPLRAGDRFSLLALDSESVVSVAGARYPLDEARLRRAHGLGVSNVALGPVRVTLRSGAVVVVAPGEDGGGRVAAA
jgi:thiamine pyrophosphokinase